ncbi:MAG TPA: penicillin-binding protein [Alphaproteobacteria bacterium]|nr:penicillin-binding protein [Alphaproteobacteria bacterium]
MPKPENSGSKRFYFLAAFLSLWFLGICARLVWLQVVDYGFLAQKAAHQQLRSIEVSPVRGNIYDRNGNELAMTINVDSIFAVPAEVPDISSTARLLGRILKTDSADIENRMRASRAFAWVARKVDNETSVRIRSLKLKGIYFQKESKRFYPKGELAAQLLGYVGLDDEGLGGVEREFDSKLQGKPGRMLISMDAKRRWFGRVEKNPDPGENVGLTLDEKIQYIAERELEKAMRETQSVSGAIIVQNPHTGEILALANRPTFDPNAFNRAAPNAMKNRAVSDIYEPGSTFKVVTLAAALEEKLTRPQELIDCQMGSIVVNGHTIHDHKPYGELTVAKVLANSSDVGTIKIALRLGDERFDRYIRAFGFGTQTGIELPGETRGITKPVSRWSKVSIGAISMGQEIGVSAVQLISMVSTIANDGVYVPPRIIAGTTPPRSTTQLIAFHPPAGRRIISAMTAAQMKHMMEGVILSGTGPRAILNGYSSAGKTGTAQKIDPATGTYSKWRHIASFAGFAPVNNPAVTVLVILDSPVGPHEGGQVAAPVFSRVAQQVLAYLNVPHDTELLDPARLKLRAQIKDSDIAEGSPDRIAGDGEPPIANPTEPVQRVPPKIVAAAYKPAAGSRETTSLQAPAPTQPSPPRARGTVVLDVEGAVVVPDFHGKPLRAALEQAQSLGIELEITGSGAAVAQSPPPGAKVPPGGHVSVQFGH